MLEISHLVGRIRPPRINIIYRTVPLAKLQWSSRQLKLITIAKLPTSACGHLHTALHSSFGDKRQPRTHARYQMMLGLYFLITALLSATLTHQQCTRYLRVSTLSFLHICTQFVEHATTHTAHCVCHAYQIHIMCI